MESSRGEAWYWKRFFKSHEVRETFAMEVSGIAKIVVFGEDEMKVSGVI